jgi:predicted DNA-binding transcriptional regulator AlpA
MENSTDLLTTDELARITGLAVITIQHWRATGRGPAYLKLGRAVRYEKDAVARFFAENRAA